MEKTVKTIQELKEAINNEEETIYIDKILEEELKCIIKIMKLPEKKIVAIIGFLAISGTAIITSIAATPVTGGSSAIVGAVAGVPAVTAFAATSGVSVSVLIPLIAICVTVGVTRITQLFKCYDLQEEEESLDLGFIKFTRRSKYRK